MAERILHTTDAREPNEVANEMRYFQRFAAAAYDPENRPVDGFSIDRDFSNRHRTLYVSNDDPTRAIFAFRGTDVKGRSAGGDLGSDALLAAGLSGVSSRFKNTEKAVRAAQTKYNDLSVVGHSLGGSQTIDIAEKVPGLTKAVAFSPHVSWLGGAIDRVKSFFGFGRRKNQTPLSIYTTAWDPVAAHVARHGLSGAGVTTVKLQSFDPHSLANFK